MSLKLKVTLDLKIPLEVAEAVQKGKDVESNLQKCLEHVDEEATKEAIAAAVKAQPSLTRKREIFTMFVALPNGKSRTLHVEPGTTVKTIAEMIREKEGIAVDDQYLRHRGKLIWGKEHVLTRFLIDTKMAELDIQECSTIQLSVRHTPALGRRASRTSSPPPQSHGSQRPSYRDSRNPPPRPRRVRPSPRAPIIDGGSQVGETNDKSSAQPTIFSKISISIMGAGIPAGHTITLPTAWLGLTLRTVAEIVSAREGVLLKNVSLYADGQLVFSGIRAVMEEVLQLRALAFKQRDNLRAVIWTENVDPASWPSPAASTEGADL